MQKHTWFITGINRGLGRHLAEQALERGDRVAGTARDVAQLDGLRAAYGDRLWVASLDLTDVAAIREVVAAAFAALGRIDAIVSNAGYSVLGAAEELRDGDIAHLLATNLVGPIQLARAALPFLRAQGGGRLVPISSGAGHMGVPGLSLYCASKWGIEGFFEALALEVAAFGIAVTLVEPGTMRTEFGTSGVLSPDLAPYGSGPIAALRKAAIEGYEAPVDPARCARLILASLDTNPAPQRLVLGQDSYDYITTAIRQRLAQLEPGRELAASADFPR